MMNNTGHRVPLGMLRTLTDTAEGHVTSARSPADVWAQTLKNTGQIIP